MSAPAPQFFETISKSFVDVPITEEGVDTESFLEAADNLVKIFDLFGNPAFSVVKNDLTGNIAAVRTYHNEHKTETNTLEKLLAYDKATRAPKAKETVTEKLMWLLRGLKFTALGLRNSIDNPSEELTVSFTKAYEGSLRKFHGIMIRPVFSLAMKACPYRATFYPKLGEPQSEVLPKLEQWLSALEAIVAREAKVYQENKYGEI